jgi:hypothetical protein
MNDNPQTTKPSGKQIQAVANKIATWRMVCSDCGVQQFPNVCHPKTCTYFQEAEATLNV